MNSNDFTDSLMELESEYRPDMTVEEIISAYELRIMALKEGVLDDEEDASGE